MIILCFSFMLVLSLPRAALQLIISNSSINTCVATDNSTSCKNLITVQLLLQNGQNNTEQLSFKLNTLTNQLGQSLNLKNPISITFQKSPIMVSYNTLYVQDMNYYPQEQVIPSSYLTCTEGIYLGSTSIASSTCTVQKDGAGKPIPNTQGYCCSCPVISFFMGIKSESTRGNCGFFSNSETAFCLHLPNEWYSMYQVLSYQYSYTITATMSTIDSNNKTSTSKLLLSNTIKTRNTGIYQATILGVSNSSNFRTTHLPILHHPYQTIICCDLIFQRTNLKCLRIGCLSPKIWSL